MNATERIVEQYFRLCLNCLTVTDLKVIGGVNRQLDLLAYNVERGIFMHVEISVTHGLKWIKKGAKLNKELEQRIKQKFFGELKSAEEGTPENPETEHKNYQAEIEATYKRYGATPWGEIERVWCFWHYNHSQEAEQAWQERLAQFAKESGCPVAADKFRLLSFRDKVLPRLINVIGTSHYDDDLLRLLSLQKASELQLTAQTTPPKKKKANNLPIKYPLRPEIIHFR